ncbi:MAG: hypothetical protein WCY19_04615 [Candidatus Gastranaerophilaceae bacterium]
MANKKLSEGVGKKIVEALKKQSEIEISPISTKEGPEEFGSMSDNLSETFENTGLEAENAFKEEDFLGGNLSEDYLEDLGIKDDSELIIDEEAAEQPEEPVNQPFTAYQQPAQAPRDSFISELDNFEIPGNIAVLKKLITQLPSGVTRHTGAQIIKQTMEALGISMKSVLQEAQQVQDGLNNSAKECYSSIQEYKKQIMLLEKQAQNHQKQCSALNELISLFIQTGI